MALPRLRTWGRCELLFDTSAIRTLDRKPKAFAPTLVEATQLAGRRVFIDALTGNNGFRAAFLAHNLCRSFNDKLYQDCEQMHSY